MARDAPVQVGAKRKRVVSGNENAHAGGRPNRGAGTLKRRRGHKASDSDVPNHDSQMHVAKELNDTEPDTDPEDTDEFLIHEAPEWKLARLKKDQLLELYSLAGLEMDSNAEITKADIVADLIRFRTVPRRAARIPRRHPITARGRPAPRRCVSQGDLPDPPSSSSEDDCDGNDAGDEETDGHKRPSPLRRRATQDQHHLASPRPLHGRSFSLNQLNPGKPGKRTRGVDARTVNATKNSQIPLSFSSATDVASPPPSSPVRISKGKHVEFDELPSTEDERTHDKTSRPCPQPSPRRLRNRTAERTLQGSKVRKTPARRAKKLDSLKEEELPDEDEEQDDDEWQELEEQEPETDSQSSDEPELDDAMALRTPSPSPPRRRGADHPRLRRTQIQSPPSDGDDEDTADDSDNSGEAPESNDAPRGSNAVDLEPRRLRSGRIIPEDEEAMEVVEDSPDELDEIEEESMSSEESVGRQEEDPVEEDVVDMVEDTIDLSNATAKSLVRLRRDDLVRLCETRDLDVDGTKPQLVKALLTWRDHRSLSQRSPSSGASTAVPSTPRRQPSGSSQAETPVLMRSDRVHVSQPRTPPRSDQTDIPPLLRNKETETELEIDLESLGLEDREIPPDKLVKLEKIGSGGFKDVFVGKLRGRKVAIAEFRGQLSPMDIKELKLLRDFDHPNVVRFLGVSLPENPRDTPVVMVSELCANGDLFDYIRNVPPPPLNKVLHIMLDIARGIEYLHLRKPSVIHRDCKSSNILITSRVTAKIADFGLAKVKQSTRSMVRSLVGTVNWQAPELWHAHPKYDHKVDVFSCGMVFWEILQWHNPNKKYPWEGMNEHAIYEAVGSKKQRPLLTGLRKQWTRGVVDLVDRMWAQEPRDRPTISEVVQDLQELLRA